MNRCKHYGYKYCKSKLPRDYEVKVRVIRRDAPMEVLKAIPYLEAWEMALSERWDQSGIAGVNQEVSVPKKILE